MKTPHPYLIQTYSGYIGQSRLFLKGRVLENEKFLEAPSDSKWKNFLETFRRFESDEIAGARVKISFDVHEWELESDSEGFFKLDIPFFLDFSKYTNSIRVQVQLLSPVYSEPLITDAEIFIPNPTAPFGVISDIDDTILQTHMNSKLRLRMMYVSFLQGAHRRLPMEGIVELFQHLAAALPQHKPFFYVSNSPWNIYDLLSDFIQLQKLPAGPIMLRDYGLHLLIKSKKQKVHKIEAISHILETYPNLPFVLFGDTASSDADHYAHFKNEYPDQIKAVYIRHTKETRNARRVQELIEQQKDPDFILIKKADEIRDHASRIGLLT